MTGPFENAAEAPENTDDPVRAELIRLKDARAEVIRIYHAEPDQVLKNKLVHYVCGACGTVLFVVWRHGLEITDAEGNPEYQRLYWRRKYKLPHYRNRVESNAAGRATNSVDGANHWPESGGVLDDFKDWDVNAGDYIPGFAIRDDHVDRHLTFPEILADADRATTTHPVRRRF